LALAALMAAFMASDKLWLHWYVPNTGQSSFSRSAPTTAITHIQRVATALTSAAGPEQTMTPRPLPQSRDAFGALWVAGQGVTYRIRYEMSSSKGDTGNSYVIFNMPPWARIDAFLPNGSEPSSQLVTEADGTTIACSLVAQRRSCTHMTTFGGLLPAAAGPIVYPPIEAFGSLSVTEVRPKLVAGTSARCFDIPSNDAAQPPTQYCFTASGVPVYASGPFGIVEATQVSSDVSASDFEGFSQSP
jgi:hypothetical protein